MSGAEYWSGYSNCNRSKGMYLHVKSGGVLADNWTQTQARNYTLIIYSTRHAHTGHSFKAGGPASMQ